MISLHHDDIFIYDIADQWAIKGKQELIAMVEDWFKDISLGEVVVDFSNLPIAVPLPILMQLFQN